MWIVVVVETYYPSVLHYETEQEAISSFERNKREGFVTHIAKVSDTYKNLKDERSKYSWDVEWHGVER